LIFKCTAVQWILKWEFLCICELSATAENSSEILRKELTIVRKQLTDSNYEKEKYNSSNKELREYVKRIEGDKREQGRGLEEAYQKISSKCEVTTMFI
jgi:rootletin